MTFDATSLAIDGRVAPLTAARFHYWQWPSPASWPIVLRRIRANGYDAVAIDVFWGYHSARPGASDFSGIRDLDGLFDDAARAQLYVAVDSGPYSANGAEAGGIPDWLLAHTAGDATLDARYVAESREWLRRVDAIVARHQLTDGAGTIVLDRFQPGALDSLPAIERDARRAGVRVPFGSLRTSRSYQGYAWGWTTAPNPDDRIERLGRFTPALPSQPIRWRMRRDDLEITERFEDQAWPPLLTPRQFDPQADDDGDAIVRSDRATAARYFGVDDYGFHHGIVWYRGHVRATGNERQFVLSGSTGRDGAVAVWLDGRFIGSGVADDAGAVRSRFTLPAQILHVGRDNVLSVLFENAGHDADQKRDSPDAPSRGMFAASLEPPTPIRWRILGNGEYNVDARRGPLADGGLAGEIAGWQYPEYSDADWAIAQWPFVAARPGVVWYRAVVSLPLARDLASAPAVRLAFSGNARVRAFVYCNGWLMGRVAASGAQRRVVDIDPELLSHSGDDTLAIALWTLSGRVTTRVTVGARSL